MEIKNFNTDEFAARQVDAMLAERDKETYTKEELRNELVSCICFTKSYSEALSEGYFGTFGQAIESMRRGFKVTRAGWNGKGMYLWVKPGVMIKAEWCKDEKLRQLAESKGGEIEGLPTICMKTADNKILAGWLASQTDMLAADWYILTE